MKKYMLAVAVGLLFACAQYSVHAATPTMNADNYYSDRVVFFNGYSFGTGTNYVYSDSGGTSTTTGWIPVAQYKDGMTLSYNFTDTDAGTWTIKQQGRVGTDSANFIFDNVSVSVGGTVSGSIMISERLDEIRIGVVKTGTTTGKGYLGGSFYKR